MDWSDLDLFAGLSWGEIAFVYCAVFFGFFVRVIPVPALFMLGYWFVFQILGGLPTLSGAGEGGGVAFWAHVGGFVTGVVLALPARGRVGKRRGRRKPF